MSRWIEERGKLRLVDQAGWSIIVKTGHSYYMTWYKRRMAQKVRIVDIDYRNEDVTTPISGIMSGSFFLYNGDLHIIDNTRCVVRLRDGRMMHAMKKRDQQVHMVTRIKFTYEEI